MCFCMVVCQREEAVRPTVYPAEGRERVGPVHLLPHGHILLGDLSVINLLQ